MVEWASTGAGSGVVDHRALGAIGIVDRGEPVAVGGPTQRRLLAILLVHRNAVVSVDRLCEVLFAGEPTAAAPGTLRSYVARLRRVVERAGSGARVVTQAPGYKLEIADEVFDVARFEAAVEDARRSLTHGDAAGAALTLRDGLGLWRGEAYAEFADEDFALAEVQRLGELRLVAHELLADAGLACGRATEVVSELETLTSEHPLREVFQARLMLALYRSGRQADALRVYQSHRRALAEDLGLDPSPELIALEQRILTHDETLGETRAGELPLRGYRLAERLGTGRDGTVHAARLPGVDRDTVIRIIPEDLANDPAFVGSFDAEARRLAALHHDAVVPIYDWWREPGVAYLVMRRLRGGTLRDRLQRGPLPAADVAALVTRVGAALQAAADSGLGHGRVSAESILFDEAGAAHLGDFPVGTGGTRDVVDDVRGLASVVAEGLGGRAPDGSGRGELSSPVPEVVTAALSAREPMPLERFVRSVVGALADGAPRPARSPPNPYKGLRAFDEPDADDFFGRDGLVDEILGRLSGSGVRGRLVLVVGGSGSGKSSLVRAGMLPRVRERWFVAAMVPGSAPFKELAEALRTVAVAEADRLDVALAAGERGIDAVVRAIVPAGGELLLFVDQLEELFTLADEATQRAFLDGLIHALSAPGTRLRVVATLRADFYEHPLRFDTFGAAVGDATVPIPVMAAAELEAAIVGPAERVGGVVEPALVAELVGATVHEPAALPSLQFTLYELAERSPDRQLTLAAYRELGGVDGAIAARAETLYRSLDDGARQGVRRLFERLVVVGPEGGPTRRRTLRSELEHAAGGSATEVLDVIEAWAQARLLTLDHHPRSREATVEVAHEALLREWPRLRGWLDDDRQEIVAFAQLREAAAAWDDLDRDAGALYRGARLDTVLQLAEERAGQLPPLEREFVEASRAERDREREREVQEMRRAVRANRRLRIQLVALAIALVAALVVGLVAVRQRDQATTQRRVATARELAAAANANLDVDPERSVLLALAAVDQSQQGGGAALPEAEQALHDAVVASRIERRVPGVGGAVAWSPDGTHFAAADTDGAVAIHDAATGEETQTIAAHDERVNGIAFSPDGARLGTTGEDGSARVWDLATGEELHRLESPTGRDALAPSFSPDGSLFAASWWNEDFVRILNLDTGRVERELGFVHPVTTSFDPSGTRMAVAAREGPVAVVDVRTGDEVLTLHGVRASGAAWSPDGASLAVATEDGSVRIFDAANGEQRLALPGHRDRLTAIGWGAGGSRVVTASEDGSAKVWRIADGGGQELFTLSAQDTRGGVAGVALSPNGTRIVTGDVENTAAIVWDASLAGDAELANVPAAGRVDSAVAFTPDGRDVLTGNATGGVTIWDARSLTPLRSLGDRETQPDDIPRAGDLVDPVLGDATVTTMAVSPDGQLVAAVVRDLTRSDHLGASLRVWDIETGREPFRVPQTGWVDDVAWTPDGEHLAMSVSEDVGETDGRVDLAGNVTIVDRSGREVAFLPDDGGEVQTLSIAFTQDGARFIGTRSPMEVFRPFSSHVVVWDWEDERLERTIDIDGAKAVLSPTEDIIVSTTEEFHVQSQDVDVWDWATGEHLGTLSGHTGAVTRAAFSPDGSRLATASTDGTVRVWDPRTKEQQLVLGGHDGRAASVAFSPDGSRFASAAADGTVRIWALDLDELAEVAARDLTRGLTDDECRQYLHIDRCPSS